MPTPLEAYLKDLREIHATGAESPEVSGYPALAELLNAVGATLKPRVRSLINPANRGAGVPDGGLFTRDQFQRASDREPKEGQFPARGVIEVKAPDANSSLSPRFSPASAAAPPARCSAVAHKDSARVRKEGEKPPPPIPFPENT